MCSNESFGVYFDKLGFNKIGYRKVAYPTVFDLKFRATEISSLSTHRNVCVTY